MSASASCLLWPHIMVTKVYSIFSGNQKEQVQKCEVQVVLKYTQSIFNHIRELVSVSAFLGKQSLQCEDIKKRKIL